MADTLEGRPQEIIAGVNYAHVAIPRADGTVQTVIVWADTDGTNITLNSAEGRQWPENLRRAGTAQAALLAEVTDQHIATLAGNAPPEVISSDRHTVKPWFQGKLPFSFNLPASLPPDTTLDGANLAYLQGRLVGQLLFSVGRHKVSVFVEQSTGAADVPTGTRAGFHVVGFRTADLQGIAVSDVDQGRLNDLVAVFKAAQ